MALRRATIICLLAIPVLVFVLTADAANQAHILVRFGGQHQTVNRNLLGQNILFAGNGMWDTRINELDPEAACLIKKLHPPIMRFPGGSISDLYIWEDGLGAPTTSPVTPASTAITLGTSPLWTGVHKLRLIDQHGGRYGDLGSFLAQKGNSLLGVKGFVNPHPPGASLRPELRPGQISWHSNRYGIIEHLKLCESLGAQPLMTVNYGSGLTRDGMVSSTASKSQRVKRAMAWVAYLNSSPEDDRPLGRDEEDNDWHTVGYWAQKRLAQGHPQPYAVRYWEIGNEIYNCHEVGFTSAQLYGEDFVQFAQAMKLVDPQIKIGAVGLADPNGKGDADHDAPWNATVLNITRNYLDFLILHPYYPSAGAHPIPYHCHPWFSAVMGAASQAFAHLKEIRSLIDTSCERAPEIKLVVSEYGIWPADSKSGQDYSNLARALYDADLLLTLFKHGQELGVDLAMAWNFHGNNPTAAVRFDIRSESRVLRPQYFVYESFQSHLGRTIIPVQVTSPVFSTPRVGNVGPLKDIPCLQVLATSTPPDRLNLWVLNRSLDQNIATTVTIQQYYPRPTALVRCLTGASPAAHNEIRPCEVMIHTNELQNVGPTFQYSFPAHSLTLIESVHLPCATGAERPTGRNLVEDYGFWLLRVSGSHRIFSHPDCPVKDKTIIHYLRREQLHRLFHGNQLQTQPK